MKILFRLDATTAIGTGHLMRALTLAQAFVSEGQKLQRAVTCCFYTQTLPAALNELVLAHGFSTLHTDKLHADIAPIEAAQPDLVIVDHYALDARWESKLYGRFPLLVLDDLADRTHQANWLLDQGPLRHKSDYQPWLNSDCQLLLGGRYALIRPEFRAVKKNQDPAVLQHGFICFGGADPVHATLKLLTGLNKVEKARTIHWRIVAGAANPDWLQLQTLCQTCSLAVELIHHDPNISQQLDWADFAIGAAGGMTWERCCVGLPTLAVPIVDNQSFNAQVIDHFQLARLLDFTQLDNTLVLNNVLAELGQKANVYRHNSQRLIDGYGANRVAKQLISALF
ncbi:UDP-2,4-diacetamido-2,4,6-trideoxy-beta-L-altropyranose hydrolase [Celerinatantimonas diazotrophica]|uniref:UDP-2,4-diacetamido-2,4, 6-trideoxy-beta-L-altropyranose hydrolase n=1 Tax=Celerinatantimonas diazotrophica TaxID=412034 RepID=A0A4R1KB03_9GAMM|nr:UDP-2,4-diacetamido-2,4,6-trideoxy-beta-L-altropyranose hydrolase [Celerinatantimonas diazotrophica]TCK61093.1 UDP-2,4-diacetamido-2,4,6-trideoxy-beta-L-altropyranose hydrolase [Celerinatantimonas diazotrophica]CAG9295142.1 UDP-2,4-diacetamido-2,4, 6-trideoxy-beta-L-altropyranose hydrolase [Celerinatantimonas diazotrophica]